MNLLALNWEHLRIPLPVLGTKGSAPSFLPFCYCCRCFGARSSQALLTFGISRKYSRTFLEEQIRQLTWGHALLLIS